MNMPESNRKEVLMVVGADRIDGISGMICQIGAARGFLVEAVGLRRDSGKELESLIRDTGRDAIFTRCDARITEEAEGVIQEVLDRRSRVDALVVTAAIAPVEDQGILTAESDDIIDAFSKNYLPAHNFLRGVLPIMLEQQSGHIVLIGTLNTHLGQYGQYMYSVGKAPLEILMKNATTNFARYGITVNMVTPGTTPNRGESWRRRREENPNLEAAIASHIPRGQCTTPAEVAETVLFFASSRCAVYGQEIVIDGGVSASGGIASGDWQSFYTELHQQVDVSCIRDKSAEIAASQS